MSPADPARTKARTALGRARLESGLTVDEMVRLTGIHRDTYRDLERGNRKNPSRITFYVNCAIVLGRPLEDVLEPQWLRWTSLRPQADEPPAGRPERVLLGGSQASA